MKTKSQENKKIGLRPTPPKTAEENLCEFNVGDLVRINERALFLSEEHLGQCGIVTKTHETNYPRGMSGRENDGMLYYVSLDGGTPLKLFADELEKVEKNDK